MRSPRTNGDGPYRARCVGSLRECLGGPPEHVQWIGTSELMEPVHI